MAGDSTTAMRLDGLPEPLRSGIVREAERELLPMPEDAPAFFTLATEGRRRLFRRTPPDPQPSALVIGPRHLAFAIDSQKYGLVVTTAALDDIRAGRKSEVFQGTNLEAATAGSDDLWLVLDRDRGAMTISLRPPDGDKALAMLVDAIRRAKAGDPPP